MFEIKAEDRSYLRVMEQLELLGLDRKTRDKMLRRIGAQIAKTTRKNIRAQRDPDGSAWAKRKRGRGKLLKGFTQKLKHFQRDNNRTLVVGWPSARGRVAYEHHHGIAQESGLSARKRQAKQQNEPRKTDPATREQAKRCAISITASSLRGDRKEAKSPLWHGYEKT
ncbi:orf22 [Bacteriophage K139]|uniref:Orf22 n=2 Tax=Longwoodvirus K139 TaxID=70734 RepID=Q8W746_9CAUD|nr:tail completion or Neck1 protein [Bacteriophage K139]YP_001650893.1 tail completion or Neck1 protein [Vibrio phage Kappa]AAL47521.1 orf22 [Bacteriophage K139]BAF98821.1 putative tail completion protein [Vibrio virus Kappa] [Vibrio phage Kappa]